MTLKRLGAVLPGLIASVVAGFILNLGILSLVYLLGRALHIPDALRDFNGSSFRWAFGLVVAFVATVTGGYVSTWLAKDDGLRTALIFGSTYLVLGVASALLRPAASPWWVLAGSLALIVPAAVAGGYLARRRA